MTDSDSFTIKGKVWRYQGQAGWYFVNLNRRDSARVRKLPLAKTVAWGYVRVKAKLGGTAWKTTLFPAKGGIYMIAIKAAVRKKEGIEAGDRVQITVTVENIPLFPESR
jgi:hypothetical protein